MKPVFITLIQFCSGPDKQVNLNKAKELIEQACTKLKADCLSQNNAEEYHHLVCLPEVFNFRSNDSAQNETAAEQIPGGLAFEWAKKIAQENNVWLIAGSILEVNESKQKPYNSCFAISAMGELLAKYRKINLFRLQLENSPELCEPKYRSAGKQIISFETPFANIGLAICFDLRFPQIFRELRKQGCQLIVLPSAFTYKTGEAHWEVLSRARAIENQVYFAAVNQGPEANCWGHSMLVDPWGRVSASLELENEGFITSELNLDLVGEVQQKLPMEF